jgi:hypothetical protein
MNTAASSLDEQIKAAMRSSLMNNKVEAEQSANVDSLVALASAPAAPVSIEPEPVAQLLERMRSFEADHTPDGWPAVRMRDISALCAEIERLTGERDEARADANAAIFLVTNLRFAFGDNGKRMRDELIEYARLLAAGQESGT